MWAVIRVMHGAARIGPHRPISPARSICFNRLTRSARREASPQDCKPVIITCCPNRLVLGAEVDASFPAFPNLAGYSIGGTSKLSSPTLGAETYSETVLSSGTVRARIGYAPGKLALLCHGRVRLDLRPTDADHEQARPTSPFLWRLGWAAGAGVELPVAPRWTARLEYLFTGYGITSVTFPAAAQRFDSDFSVQEFRAGVNYQFGNDATPANALATAPATPAVDISTSTARPPSSGRAILRSDRPIGPQ